MKHTLVIGILLAALTCSGSARISAQDNGPDYMVKPLLPADELVFDTYNYRFWLADANLAAKTLPGGKNFRFGLPLCDVLNPPSDDPCVNASGTMNYTSAVKWVKGMNDAGYLGRHDWQLPATPKRESDCTELGPLKNSFGFDCDENALGYLYYSALGIKAPDTAVPIPPNTVGPFSNFQPSLYWGGSPGDGTTGGIAVFSFANGAQGGSTQSDYLYVLPMLEGELSGSLPIVGRGLYVYPGGQAVYDIDTDVTWVADANLAATERFGLPRCDTPAYPSPCVAKDGSMNYDSAVQFIANMNSYDHGDGYLGQTNWQLPPVDASCPTYGCGGDRNPMGDLYYKQLKIPPGTPVVEAPDIPVGPFNHIQPSQYWSCLADGVQDACKSKGVGPGDAEFGFSFGDGFLGTTGRPADHFVIVYFPCEPPHEPAECFTRF